MSSSPRPAFLLMIATYLVGGVGIAAGFSTVLADQPSLSLASVLAVGAAGLLSFVRHSIFHRSDAARLGWDLGQRNNFQIEVGLANLAWGLLAIVAVVFDLGLAVEAASLFVFGAYLTAVAIMLFTTDTGRAWPQRLAMASFGIMLLILAVLGFRAV